MPYIPLMVEKKYYYMTAKDITVFYPTIKYCKTYKR